MYSSETTHPKHFSKIQRFLHNRTARKESGRIKDNHGHITKVHRKDVKKIPMTEKVCQLYEEEQLGKTREGRKAVPANKMPDLGWDIAETTEIKENRQKTNNIPLALQTIVTIIIIISVIIRLSTTQLGRLAMFLKEAAIMTLRVSRNVYRQKYGKVPQYNNSSDSQSNQHDELYRS